LLLFKNCRGFAQGNLPPNPPGAIRRFFMQEYPMTKDYETADQRVVTIKMPNELVAAIEKAASRELITTSAFVRRAALRAVKQDGGE
jgi:predicted DNA binding CopG/RHH family protein